MKQKTFYILVETKICAPDDMEEADAAVAAKNLMYNNKTEFKEVELIDYKTVCVTNEKGDKVL